MSYPYHRTTTAIYLAKRTLAEETKVETPRATPLPDIHSTAYVIVPTIPFNILLFYLGFHAVNTCG